MINTIHHTWDTLENKTWSPALVEYTVYNVFPIHLWTPCDLGQVNALLCPMEEQEGWAQWTLSLL